MRAVRTLAIGAPVAIGLVLGASAARADVIDGEWCTVDHTQHMIIQGPAIVTPGGHRIQGNYSRHAFSYVVPTGEPGTGQTVLMVLVNPETVNSRMAADAAAAADAPMLVWHHCKEEVS